MIELGRYNQTTEIIGIALFVDAIMQVEDEIHSNFF